VNHSKSNNASSQHKEGPPTVVALAFLMLFLPPMSFAIVPEGPGQPGHPMGGRENGGAMAPYDQAFGMVHKVEGGPDYEDGSLWGDRSRFNNPFGKLPSPDFYIGDTIVVQVAENFLSTEDIRLRNDTKSNIDFNVSNLLTQGLDKDILGTIPGGTSIDYPNTNIKAQDKYDAESRGQRRSQLKISFACTVKKILPDGRLLIEGRQARIIGRDKKNRILSGIVQPEDIDPVLRIISSDRVADSQLRWEGDGPGENVSKPGFIHRILDYIPVF
jgi:flagellar basal body L-ring protein FlgH